MSRWKRCYAAVVVVIVAGLALACSADRTAPWVTTRDALLAVDRDWHNVDPDHAAALLAELSRRDGQEPDEAIELEPALALGDTVTALARYDATRLRSGLPPRTGGTFTLTAPGSGLRIAACGPLLPALNTDPAPSSVRLRLAAHTDAELAERVQPHLPALAAWLESCSQPPPKQTEVVVRIADGAPVLAAWWPQLGLLELHPALFMRLPDTSFMLEVRTVPLGELQPPFTFDGTFYDCMTQLDLYCRRCPGGNAGAGCEPLFALNPEPVTCTMLDGSSPGARERYCSWMQAERDPTLATCMADYAHECALDITVDIVDPDVLNAALPVPCPLDDLTCEAVAPQPPEPPGPALDLDTCLTAVESFCDTCLSNPQLACEGLFARSTGALDCYDLGRTELNGRGPVALCARKLIAFDPLRAACFNAADSCHRPLQQANTNDNFQIFVEEYGGFIDPATADDCQAQALRCVQREPIEPAIDLDALQPGAEPPTPTDPADEEEQGCPF